LISGTYNEKEANDRENEIITYNKKIDILKVIINLFIGKNI
jgi:hypothetical protein